MRKKHLRTFVILLFSVVILTACALKYDESITIEKRYKKQKIASLFKGQPLFVTFAEYNAYAISSIRWKDKEFVDDWDHGRQCQSASQFNYLGEGFNPTQAGGSHYHYGINPGYGGSISLGTQKISEKSFASHTKMAFWNPVEGVRTSNHELHNRVTIGYQGMDNVIEYLVQFDIPETEKHTMGLFEILTCYAPPEFTQFYQYKDNDLLPTKAVTLQNITEQNAPPIMATEDGNYAIGVIAEGVPQQEYSQYGYGTFRIANVPKINSAYRMPNPSGSYNFRAFIIIGTLADVRESMKKLL